jgi:hypothetical protein
MDLIVTLKSNKPDSNGSVCAEYYKKSGNEELCFIDVFINKEDPYSVPVNVSTTQNETVVAILTNTLNINTIIGVAIRRQPVSTVPQDEDIFYDHSFLSKP